MTTETSEIPRSFKMMDAPSRARREIPPGVGEGRWLAADGKTAIRRIDWPVPAHARGSLLFLPGRGDCYEKWLETLEQWREEGWAVTAIDWRGQALSGRLGRDGTTGHVDDFGLWIDDLAKFWADWSAERPGPHVLAGHSMGGHLAMRAVAERRIVPDALVLSAPMLGIHPTAIPAAILHPVARVIAALGDSRRPAWKGNEKPQLIPNARALLLTHDDSRYADEDWWRRERPAIAMGPASWGWIERALASIRGLERKGVLESVEVPVLLLGARHDGLVSWPAIRRAAARLPHAELVDWGRECRHEILREVDSVRDRAMEAIRDFLNRAVPAGR